MTFEIKVRGSGGLLMAEYRCPVDGVFEVLVERDANGDPPAQVTCATVVHDGHLDPPCCAPDAPCEWHGVACGLASPWTISAPPVHTQFVVTATHGRNAEKPHREALDTRPLAEGRKKEWRINRQKLREERRHKRVKELLK